MPDPGFFLQQAQLRLNNFLIQTLKQQPVLMPGHAQALEWLCEAQLYSIRNGGKRLRPALVYAVAQSLDGELNTHDADLLAAALECIHSYSLIHDDLPAMDNDSLRRGQPSCHIAFDEATAILAGDGLQAFAYELLAQLTEVPPAQALAIIRYLARASGNKGMVGGQMIDLQATNKTPDITQMEYMHRLKTGALIQAAVLMPAIAMQADQTTQTALAHYARAIGLAFQVQDDILDIESDTETLGKSQGADERLNKPTYPSLLGLELARQKAAELIEQAHAALAGIKTDCRLLHELADFITRRRY